MNINENKNDDIKNKKIKKFFKKRNFDKNSPKPLFIKGLQAFWLF